MKRSVSLALLVAMLTLCVSGAALAATRFDTKLTISYSRASGGRFSGKVDSQKHAVHRRIAKSPCIERSTGVIRRSARTRAAEPESGT